MSSKAALDGARRGKKRTSLPRGNGSLQFFGCNVGNAGLLGDGLKFPASGQSLEYRLDGVQVYPNLLVWKESPARAFPLFEGRDRLSLALQENQGDFRKGGGDQ
jgi:hypothetical protein